MNKRPIGTIQRFRRLDVGEIGVSAITVSELQYGVAKSRSRRLNEQRVEEFLLPLEIIPYDEVAADIYGDLRHALEKTGKPIGPLDLLIAAHALSRHLVLVTNNEREFRRVGGLKLENWTK